MKVEQILKSKAKFSIEKKVLINLQLVSTKTGSEMMCTLKEFGVSVQQFNVLRILRGQDKKPANLSTIQDRMVHQMSNTTRLVDKLIEKKLVDRCICEENRRKVEIVITQQGLDLLNKIDPKVEALEKESTKGLNQEELKQLNILLEKLRS
ncbi:MarR family winged helix-turn-helix transcriptional regulator [Mesonia aestuariivivens]|uniref:MarR family transcriptional regulator n=1 Tax=Mesonia aestuariivivens TaxID=2796128 RepID=A0ABS6VZG2_9FLAO|nr:MarR family transcriptional regulator [Mesonia aestuariivivens]MBW2960889.1 MarR family transcriptional regulator [Mesonia aestuariivivens]